MNDDTGRILFSGSPEAATSVYRTDPQPGYGHSSLPLAHFDHHVDAPAA